jgi:hypothetical protein
MFLMFVQRRLSKGDSQADLKMGAAMSREFCELAPPGAPIKTLGTRGLYSGLPIVSRNIFRNIFHLLDKASLARNVTRRHPRS